MKKLYVGKLSYDMTEQDLRSLFAEYGAIVSAKLIMDSYTGKSKGFAFVELEDDELAQKAVRDLDGQSVAGRIIVVNEARDDSGGGRRTGGGSGPRSSGPSRDRRNSSRGYSGGKRF